MPPAVNLHETSTKKYVLIGTNILLFFQHLDVDPVRTEYLDRWTWNPSLTQCGGNMWVCAALFPSSCAPALRESVLSFLLSGGFYGWSLDLLKTFTLKKLMIFALVKCFL